MWHVDGVVREPFVTCLQWDQYRPNHEPVLNTFISIESNSKTFGSNFIVSF